jgi:hypothetical protein
LKSKEPVGRKLDFLIQEMHREINTIGAKGADAEISKYVVESKALLENLREQVQNIEKNSFQNLLRVPMASLGHPKILTYFHIRSGFGDPAPPRPWAAHNGFEMNFSAL